MARDEFCDADICTSEWSPRGPSSHGWHVASTEKSARSRQDAIARMIEDIWQMPIEACDATEADLRLEAKFREQAEKWERETRHLSSPTQRMMHPSYQAILGMGAEHRRKVLRLMLRDLQVNRRPWFWALSYLSQNNPVKPSDAGKIDKMIQSWLNWGKAERLL